MASIKKITLKSLKFFEGRNGQGYNANIYFNNKNIGSCQNLADGSGDIRIYIEDNEVKYKINKIIEDFSKQYITFSDYSTIIENFFACLVELIEIEKLYKKGKRFAICQDVFADCELDNYFDKVISFDDIKLAECSLKKYQEKGYKNLKLYKSLDDFIIE